MEGLWNGGVMLHFTHPRSMALLWPANFSILQRILRALG
jgi:hypothetical protein